MARLYSVEPRPVIHRAIVQIDRLLHGPAVYAGQAAQSFGEMAVGARIILRPDGIALGP